MPLNLNDLLKKAEQKGIKAPSPSPAPLEFSRPWQEESILFNKPDKAQKENAIEDRQHRQESHTGTHPQEKKVIKETIKTQGTLGEQHREQVREPLENNIGNIKGTVREHLENTTPPIRERSGNTPRTLREHTGNKIGNRLGNNLENDLGNNLGNSLQESSRQILISLTGLQKNLFNYVLDLCISRDSTSTGFICTQVMARSIGCSYESAKVTLKRLIKKGLIIRLKGKTSIGGFINLEIPKDIKMIAMDLGNNLENSLGNKLGNDLGNRLENDSDRRRRVNNISSSSRDVIDEWDFDLSSFEKFGFDKGRLKQVINMGKYTPQEVEQSLIEFEHDFVNGKTKDIKKPAPYLLTCFSKDAPYSSIDYQNEMNKELTKQKERYEHQQKEKGRLAIFSWIESLSHAEKEALEHAMPTYLIVHYRVDGLSDEKVFNWVKEYYLSTKRG